MRVTIHRQINNISQEKDIAVWLPSEEPEVDLPTKMDIFDPELEVDFDFGRSKYHQKDCVVGKINIKKQKVDIKKIGVEVIREETILPGIPCFE